jgi:ribosomal protein L40E
VQLVAQSLPPVFSTVVEPVAVRGAYGSQRAEGSMKATVLSILIALLAVAISRFRKSSCQPRSDQIPHVCGSSNPPGANYCRRCGEALMIGLLEIVPDEENIQA